MVLRHPGFVLGLVAILLMGPSLVLGTLITHDSAQNLNWAAQFAQQFRAGVLYPRWLSDSYQGLGGPIFYYYPPLGYWFDALVSVATANLLSVSYRLSLERLLLLWASGLAMHAWLKGSGSSPRAALYGALAYMAAPYHLVDHYVRGAHSEFAAYAILPLVVLAVRHVADRRRFAVVFLATAYAALVLMHLLTTLLFSLTALPIYALYRAWRLGAARQAIGFLLRCVLGGALALGLAAIYLVPALTQQGWIYLELLWVFDVFRVESWYLLPFMLAGKLGTDEIMMTVALSAIVYGIASIGVLAFVAQTRAPQRWRSEAGLWACVGLLCLLFATGLVPWFWWLPFVAKVQFPWRLMAVVEFAAITGLCLAPWHVRSRTGLACFGAAIIALFPAAYEVLSQARGKVEKSMTGSETLRDGDEYLPAGYPWKLDQDSLEGMEDLPTISCTPTPAVCRAVEQGFGNLHIEVEGNAPATVVLRRFYFPAWRLDPMLAITADAKKLVTFVAPAGRHAWHLERQTLPAEQWGQAISGLSLILLLGATALGARRRD
jgi:hypothetical protein